MGQSNPSSGTNDGTDVIPGEGAANVAVDRHVKDDNGNSVVLAKRESGAVHHLQIARKGLVEGNRVVANGVVVFVGIFIVDAVYLGGLEDDVGPISLARKAAVVSVVKKGLPVPAPKMTTRPFSR
jgi:hypothetical protein